MEGPYVLCQGAYCEKGVQQVNYIQLKDIANGDLLPAPLQLVSDTGSCHYVLACWTVHVRVAGRHLSFAFGDNAGTYLRLSWHQCPAT